MISLTQTLIGLAVVAFIAILIFSGKARALVKGFINIFIEDRAATPEGADALYSAKEDDVMESLRTADEVFRKIAGQLARYQAELKDLEAKLPRIEQDSIKLAQRGDREGLYIKSQERTDVMEEIENHKNIIAKLQSAKDNAERARNDCEANLDRIKKEHKKVVTSLKQNAEMEKIYSDLNGIGADDATTALLEKVKERSQDLDDLVEGSRQQYESKISTRKQRLDERLRHSDTDDYAESLLRQYQGGRTSTNPPLLENHGRGQSVSSFTSTSQRVKEPSRK